MRSWIRRNMAHSSCEWGRRNAFDRTFSPPAAHLEDSLSLVRGTHYLRRRLDPEAPLWSAHTCMASVQQAEKPAAPDGNGKPADLASAFKDALVSAVRTQETADTEAHIAAAVSLGWYLAALAHPGDPCHTAAAARGDLGGIGAI